MYNVYVDLPYLAEGAEVQLPGLRPFKNKENNEVTDDEAALFQQQNISHEPAFWTNPDTGEEEIVGSQQVLRSFESIVEGFTGMSVEKVDNPTVDEEAVSSVLSLTPPGQTDDSEDETDPEWEGEN